MNDVTEKELKIVVERTVRPVRATMARKRKMREELLAHLVSIFEEERKRAGDEQAALDQTKRRFGDPEELTGQFQEAVPRWDRLARLGDAAQRWPGESLLRFAGRITIFTLVLFVATTLIVLPALFVRGRQYEFAVIAYTFLVVGILTIPFTLGLTLLTDGMYRALYRGQSHRSWRLATVYGLASLAFFPVLAFTWYWSLTGDLATSCAHLRLACCFAPLAPVLFAAMARQAADQMRYYEEWASLAIEE
jgi:ATP-dependent Clp protease ATP-binding subunit ClpC